VLPFKQLEEIDAGLETLVEILGAQKLPPQMMLSSEYNLPGKGKQ